MKYIMPKIGYKIAFLISCTLVIYVGVYVCVLEDIPTTLFPNALWVVYVQLAHCINLDVCLKKKMIMKVIKVVEIYSGKKWLGSHNTDCK